MIQSSNITFRTFVLVAFTVIASGIAFAALFITLRSGFTRAYSPTVIVRIRLQGEHFAPNTVKSDITFYNTRAGKVKELQNVEFQYGANDMYETTITLDSSFSMAALYAISIKPKGYLLRLFCSEDTTGSLCRSPRILLNEKDPTILNFTALPFSGGDVEPADGNVDSYDISSIFADLGKIGQNLKGDVTGDGVVNIFDYAVALSALSRTVTDDTIPHTLISPLVIPTNYVFPTSTPTPPAATPIPTVLPLPTATPIPTIIPHPTSTPVPTSTSLTHIGKKCVNGTTTVSKSINSKWELDVLPIPYGKPQYICIKPEHIVLHWSDSPNFLGNGATMGALNSKNVICGLAIDSNSVLQMSNFYDDKITWEGCSPVEDSINIEINGTQFDLWYDKNCTIVNPLKNNALAPGELQKKKEETASEYGVSPTSLDWENEKYLTQMKSQEIKVLNTVKYLMAYYSIPLENITGHNKVASNPDPGERFLSCIKKKLDITLSFQNAKY